MRRISDELLLEEVKALIASKRTPLTRQEIINWTYHRQNVEAFAEGVSVSVTSGRNRDLEFYHSVEDKIYRNRERYAKIRKLVESLEKVNGYDRL